MEGIVIERAPQAHCYRCGDVAISGVCVQCHRLMCQTHVTPRPRLLMRWLGRLFYRLRITGQPYDGSVVLCRTCQKRSLAPLLAAAFAVGLAYIGAGVWIGRQGNTWGAALILVGLLWLGVFLLAPSRLESENVRQRRRMLNVAPRVDRRQIQEWARGHVMLDDLGNYQVKELSTEGRITLTTSFSEADGKRAKKLLNKRGRAGRQPPRFHAGFFVFKGRVSNRPLPTPAFHVNTLSGPLVALADSIDNASFLTSTGGREARQWETLYGYSLIRNLEARGFPVQVLPAIRPDTGQRVLDLTVQWFSPFPDNPAIAAHQISLLKLRVPMSWGSVQYASSGFRSGSEPGPHGDEDAVRVLTWERIPLSQRDQERQRRLITIKFENPVQPAASIHGAVHVTFRNSLSGMTGIEYFTPAGRLSPLDESIDVGTIVVADYDLSLATLRYQKTLVFPPPPAQPFPEAPGEETVQEPAGELTPEDMALLAETEIPRQAAIPPDAETVVQLTNAVSDAGFYIQWIVENLPQTGATANVTNRYWDVGGRYYLGVTPIDFHMVIRGQQTSQQSQPAAASTTVDLTVKGAYVTEKMKRRIINTWIKLDNAVETKLKILEQPPKDEE